MAVERSPSGSSLIDVLDRVLDKGIVIDAWVRVSLVGIDLVTVEARIVVGRRTAENRHARHPVGQKSAKSQCMRCASRPTKYRASIDAQMVEHLLDVAGMIADGATWVWVRKAEARPVQSYMPAATDLRFILAVTKINADLERVGDQAVNIAERVMDMVELPAVELPVDIARMATAVSAMVRRALESFVEGKAELAQAVLEMDHVVDRMKDEAFIVLVRKMNEEPQVTQQAIDALLVARNLERVADHATNISEDVIFWVLGADVRHHAQAASMTPQPERREQ